MIRIDPQYAKAKKTTCACVMIVRDAEKTIRQCLDSVLRSGCFEQVVVVLDTRTKDNTAVILQEYSGKYPEVKVVWYRWTKQDYSAARNVSLLNATTDYAFWIDGDESLMDGDELYRILLNPGGKAYYAYQVSKLPDGNIIHLPQLRLFPLAAGVRFELPVHEQVAFTIRRLGIKEEYSKVRVWHLGYISEDAIFRKHQIYYGIMSDFLNRHRQQDASRNYIQEQYLKSKSYLESKS